VPLRNRVTPMGELISVPERGLVYGNRGCLHDARGEIRRSWAVKRWIACRLQFRGWHRASLMQPGRFTELFFLDEATALAAGHRPCALCRRKDYDRFMAVWAQLHPGVRGADAVDAALHRERVVPGGARLLHEAGVGGLPDGVFVLRDGVPWVVVGREFLRWMPGGYVDRVRRPGGEGAVVITPRSLVAVLRGGWEPVVPLLHPSAGVTADSLA
jgi:hypothetical protein